MTEKQNVEKVKDSITAEFPKVELGDPDFPSIPFSWNIRTFGRERFKQSVSRLAINDIPLIELPGNRFTADLGFDVPEVKKVLSDANIEVSGICGIFSSDCCFSGLKPEVRQKAMDYVKRNLDLAVELKADYFILIPGAPGRTEAEDGYEFERAVETLQKIEYLFEDSGIRGAIAPLRREEVSFCCTVQEADDLIKAIDSSGIRHISGSVFHLLFEQVNIYENIKERADRFINLHISDSNRFALGSGILDTDLLISALYTGGFRGYATGSAVPPGATVEEARSSRHDPVTLDSLTSRTVSVWRERENAVRARIKEAS